MKLPLDRLQGLTPERLRGMRRGLEKESLRCDTQGDLALTPHPLALGSALTHPHVTTDYSESQLELITGAHTSVEACLQELTEIHQTTVAALGDELMWAASMPCGLPSDETIPIARYGTSNIGRAKSIYRMGLGLRYGRRMQTISGVHYNWSLPGTDTEAYFRLIRNVRRHAFVLLYLFGASPAVCASFVEGRPHELEQIGPGTLGRLQATSLRMGRLGYQSEAQTRLCVSYNSLSAYADSLHEALTHPYPPYERLGVRNAGGEYNQLATTLLQIENEFYGTIRPKRTIQPGERPLHALRERGVEYVEVRCMDLDPFEPVGIAASTMRFLDIFLLQCLLADSPPDHPGEIQALAANQHRVAERGREPGLELERDGQGVSLQTWASEFIDAGEAVAAHLDRSLGGTGYRDALALARQRLRDPAATPSARVLREMDGSQGCSWRAFGLRQSLAMREAVRAQAVDPAVPARHTAWIQRSLEAQREMEAADVDRPFEAFREAYVSHATLTPAPGPVGTHAAG